MFKCYIVGEDGEEVDKMWYVWNSELKEELKKLLKGKNPDYAKVELEVVRHEKGIEESFEVKAIK